jgi:hypothetical protein
MAARGPDVRLLLRHDPALVPDDLRGVPADQLLGLALRALRRRWGFVAVAQPGEVAPGPDVLAWVRERVLLVLPADAGLREPGRLRVLIEAALAEAYARGLAAGIEAEHKRMPEAT